MKIKVNLTHIHQGQQGQARACPLARAVQEAIPTSFPCVFSESIVFDEQQGYMLGGIKFFTAELSPNASRWVRNFDDGLPVAPGTLVIEQHPMTGHKHGHFIENPAWMWQG